MIRFRRWIQFFCLVLFLALLTLASLSGISTGSLDFFLRLDPVLVLITAVSARILLLSFVPAAIVLLSGPVMGRVFCGYICPMGTTLDATDSLFGPGRPRHVSFKSLLKIKYLVLFFLLGSALAGVSYVFFASPISLITRFYGLILFPVISFLSREALDLIRPAADMLDIHSISFAQIRTIRFDTQFFILFFFISIFAMICFSSRFWCRYLCPAGALLALFSKRPFIRRQVTEDCNQCGKCVRGCPMAAIDRDMPENTLYSECIVCRSCENICPEDAIYFSGLKTKTAAGIQDFSPERRQIFSTGLIGAATAVMSLTGLHSLYGKPGEGQVGTPGLIRPPGAVPEIDFLSRCVRCGECMAACPTNTLQPIWFKAGVPGLFSPAITPRRGFCDPSCHSCATVCPTRAIRPVEPADRIWAKTGTATIVRQKCLAWEYNKSCMVCDEVCPYDAIEFLKEKERNVPVPHVAEDKCAGCGYCEHFCPVHYTPAIVVTPMDALRINNGSYERLARQKGFTLQLKALDQAPLPMDGGPDARQGPAPGFDP